MWEVRLYGIQISKEIGVDIAKRSSRLRVKKPKKRSKIRYLFYLSTIFLFWFTVNSMVMYVHQAANASTVFINTSISISLLFSFTIISYLFIRGHEPSDVVRSLGLSRDKLTIHTIILGITIFLTILLLSFLISIFSEVTNIPLPTNVDQLLTGLPLYFLIFTFLIAPINEEILFRGFLVPRIGIIISAILFAALHFSYASISEVFAALIFGVIAGYAFKKTGSLYPSIVAHMLINSIAIAAIIFNF